MPRMPRILVVDDDAALRLSLRTAFQRDGYEADVAASGEDALLRLRAEPFDVLLTDLVMPGMDGLGLLEQARRGSAEMVVILMTGGATVETAVRALKGGAYDYVVKPFKAADIVRVAGRGLAQRQLERENAELSLLNRRLSEVDQLKSNLLSAITHEFRTPLTLMHGWLDMLLTDQLGPLSAAQRESVQAVQRAEVRLNRLIANLLAFVEHERGAARGSRFPVNLAALIAHACEQLAPEREERRLTLAVEIDPGLPLVPGDGERLALLLFNLLENAVKFNQPGGRVIVRATREPTAAVVTVQNTRGEMPVDCVPRLLEPFTQADMTLTRAAGGLGLGLTLARAIVEAHGGSLDVTVGEGATVCVRLPVSPAGPGIS